MLKNIKSGIQKLPKTIIYSAVILMIWELILIIQKTNWLNLTMVVIGAIVGYLILEVDWVIPKKEVKQFLPIILLPVSLFILTSTSGLLGKSMIIFLNIRLITDQIIEKNVSKD